ncbi:hypothetical protein WA158_006339 [Blastocystis sp. Blastoise]
MMKTVIRSSWRPTTVLIRRFQEIPFESHEHDLEIKPFDPSIMSPPEDFSTVIEQNKRMEQLKEKKKKLTEQLTNLRKAYLNKESFSYGAFDVYVTQMLELGDALVEKDYYLMFDISSMIRNGSAAYRVMQHFISRNISIPTRCWTKCLHALSRYSSNSKAAEDVLNQMKQRDIQPSRIHYEDVMTCYINGNQINDAKRLFKEMNDNNITPNSWTYNILLGGYLKTHEIDEAMKLFNEMQLNNIKPDTITCNTIIKIMGESGEYNMMELLLKQMIDTHIPVDIITYNIIIGMFCKKGDLKKAFDIFYSIPTNLNPDLKTYNRLIIGCAKSKNMETAVNIFNQILSKKMKPTVVTYAAMCACGITCNQNHFGMDLFLQAILKKEVKNFVIRNGFGKKHYKFSFIVGEAKSNKENSISSITKQFLLKLTPPIKDFTYYDGVISIKSGSLDRWLKQQYIVYKDKPVDLNLNLEDLLYKTGYIL